MAEGFDEMTVIVAPGYDAETVARRLWDQVPQVEVLSPAQERAERQWAMLALDLVVLYSVLLTVLVGGVTTLNTTLTATHEPPATSHQPSATSHPPSAIGHQPSAISYQLVQPLLAALAGGLAGLLAGWLAALGLDAYTVHNQARTLFIVTPRLAGGVVLLSVLVGLAAGVWPALWTRLRPFTPRSSSFILPGLTVLGVALATPGVMLTGSLVESLYCSLNEGQRVAANRIGLEPTSSQVAYYEPLTHALGHWPGILDIVVEAYGGAIVEDEERWIDRLPPSGIFYGLCPALSPSTLLGMNSVEGPALSTVEGSERGDFGLGVPYRVGLWQGRVFQPGSLDEAVIGYDLAAQQGLKVGDTLTIRDHDFTVVGIRQRLLYGRMNDFNLRAEVSLEALRRVLGQPYAFGTITAFIPPAEREEDREPFLDRLVERFSGTAVVTVKDRLAEIARDFPGMERLVVESSDDTLLRARLLYFGLLAGVSISLWGLAGLGIMSGLRLSLAESRQEIQLRKLFGASDGDIMARWLERAALWGGIGGLMGAGLGWLAIEAVNLCTNSYQLSAISYQLSAISHQLSAISHQPSAISHQLSVISHQQALTLIVTPRLVVTTLVVTVLLGIIAGLGPAWQAARLGPLWED
jgi:ABC-type antimicrobial peptide transport system permease subunit